MTLPNNSTFIILSRLSSHTAFESVSDICSTTLLSKPTVYRSLAFLIDMSIVIKTTFPATDTPIYKAIAHFKTRSALFNYCKIIQDDRLSQAFNKVISERDQQPQRRIPVKQDTSGLKSSDFAPNLSGIIGIDKGLSNNDFAPPIKNNKP